MKEKTTKKDGATMIDRIMEYMKGGEKAKLVKFLRGVGKYLDNQIKELGDRIEKTTDKIEEKEEELEEYLLTIDFDKIKSTENREYYVEGYVEGYDRLVEQLEELKLAVEDDKERVKRREEMKQKIK